MIEADIAASGAANAEVDRLQAMAVQESLERLGIPARAEATPPQRRVRLMPAIRGGHPLVSIMIPTRDRPELISRCLDTLYARTAYRAFEVIIGDNETVDSEALRAIEKHPVRRVALPGAFHFSRFNNLMATEARGELLLLLNNDTEIVAEDWLDHLVAHASLPDVGAVGPVLVYADGTVQHAGLVLGPHGTADHVMRGFPADCDGYFGSLACAREVSALTGACLLVRAELYRRLGGLCEHFRYHYEDVDFCLRLRARGMRNILVAGTRLIHHESKTRGTYYDYTDRVLLLDRWEQEILRGDAYHSRHFGNDLYYRICSVGLQL
jgi:GT2 family glycosyltransferase